MDPDLPVITVRQVATAPTCTLQRPLGRRPTRNVVKRDREPDLSNSAAAWFVTQALSDYDLAQSWLPTALVAMQMDSVRQDARPYVDKDG